MKSIWISAVFLFCFLLVAGCPKQTDYIYVPSKDYHQKLEITLIQNGKSKIIVGEWIELYAKRESGPWIKVNSSEKEKYDLWWNTPPPAIEENVAGNVHWKVEPPLAQFNIPGKGGDSILTRKIKFDSPGKFKIHALSHGLGGDFSSNTIAVEVLEK